MEPTLGEIRAFAGSYAPAGWAICNGQTLPIANYEALYSLLGNTYGTATASSFYLPDLRGRLVVNQGTGPSRTNRVLGTAGGEEFVTLTAAQLGAHTHTAVAATNNATSNSPTGNYLAAPVDTTNSNTKTQMYMPTSGVSSVVALDASTISIVGGAVPHENRMPYIVINYIIALQGIYPTPN